MSNRQRRIATEQPHRAIEPINAMFDRLHHLPRARNQLTGIEPIGYHAVPMHDGASLLDHAERLIDTLDGQQAAAVVAADHRHRTDLASDIGTKDHHLVRSGLDPLRGDNPSQLADRRIPRERFAARGSKLTIGAIADDATLPDGGAIVRAVADPLRTQFAHPT